MNRKTLTKNNNIAKNQQQLLTMFRHQLTGERGSKREDEFSVERMKQYQELWDNAPVAYHILDAAGTIIQANKTEARMLGYPVEELVGKPIFNFILLEQRTEARKRFRLKLSGKSFPSKEGRIYVRKDGTKLYVSVQDVLQRDEQGKVISVRTAMIDVTERVKAQEALRKSNELLQKSQEQLIESYKHLGMINRKISLLLELEKNQKGRKKAEVVRYILDSAINLARADAGLVYTFGKDKNFRLVSCSGLSRRKQKEAKKLTGDCAIVRNLIKKPVRMQGVPAKYCQCAEPLIAGAKYFLLIPLLKEDRVKGFMFLKFYKMKTMDTHELEFFDVFSMHASTALANVGVVK